MNYKHPIVSMALDVIKKHKLLSLAMLIAATGSITAVLLPPLVLERVVDDLTAEKSIALNIILLYFILIAASGLFDAAREYFITVYGQKVTHRIRSEMCSKLSHLPAAYFTKNEPGVIASRFVNDVDLVDRLFTSGIISMLVDLCRIISIMAVIFVKSTGLGILVTITVPLIFAMTRAFQKRMLASQIINRQAVGRANNMIPETIRNIRLIHSLRKEDYAAGRYESRINESYQALEKSNFYDSVYSPIIINISTILIAVMMVLCARGGGFQDFFGMSVGSAVALISYVSRVFEPIESIGMEIQNIQSAISGIYRIREFLSEKERAAAKSEQPLVTHDSGVPAVELCGVSFGYEDGIEVLQNFDFRVMPGEQVTLTGRTGAGKSTVFRLIMGQYEPWHGSVKVFGVDSSAVPDSSRRRIFGYVEQKFHMIPGSVMDQVTLKDSSVSYDDAVKAAKLAGIDEIICALPEGYDTICEEGLFSQGQWQLLAIARAVAADPAILLLDEITANLDSETEKTVLDALQQASEDRTVISISHRV